MYLQLSVKNGKVFGLDKIEEIAAKSPDGIYSVRMSYTTRPKSILECRRHYFFICALISNEGHIGYKTQEIHNIFKENVLTKLPNVHSYIDNPAAYVEFTLTGPKVKYSTKMLNLEGWYAYLEGVKQFAKQELDFLI